MLFRSIIIIIIIIIIIVKGEAIRLLRTNSSKTTFEECLANFKRRLEARGYPNK